MGEKKLSTIKIFKFFVSDHLNIANAGWSRRITAKIQVNEIMKKSSLIEQETEMPTRNDASAYVVHGLDGFCKNTAHYASSSNLWRSGTAGYKCNT